MAPTDFKESKSKGKSKCSRVKHPPDGPPICAALKAALLTVPSSLVVPPATSSITWRRVVPMGTSTSPVLAICPVTAKVLVPGLPNVPILRNSSAPISITLATVAKVSTLLITVGLPNNPLWLGKGGLILGIPRLPSTDAISAVSSPHTKAPAPSIT